MADCAVKFKSVETQFAAATINAISKGNAAAKIINESNFWQVRVLLTKAPDSLKEDGLYAMELLPNYKFPKDFTEIQLQELLSRAVAQVQEGLDTYAWTLDQLMTILRDYLVKKIGLSAVSCKPSLICL